MRHIMQTYGPCGGYTWSNGLSQELAVSYRRETTTNNVYIFKMIINIYQTRYVCILFSSTMYHCGGCIRIGTKTTYHDKIYKYILIINKFDVITIGPTYICAFNLNPSSIISVHVPIKRTL